MLFCDRRTLLEAGAILILGLALGLFCNHRVVLSALTPQGTAAAAPAVASGGAAYPVPVELAEVQQLLASGALAVDARAAEVYALGHLPGAVSLPLGESTDRTALADRLPRNLPLITYCSGYGCSDSFDLALALLAAGYPDVRVFEGGWPAWQDAGLAIATGGP